MRAGYAHPVNYVLLIDAFYDPSNLIYAFVFHSKVNDGPLHEDTATSLLYKTWCVIAAPVCSDYRKAIIEEFKYTRVQKDRDSYGK